MRREHLVSLDFTPDGSALARIGIVSIEVSTRPSNPEIREAMLELLRERGTATACPSEVARRLEKTNWRSLMPDVRAVAQALQKKSLVDVYQRGRPVTLPNVKGPIRLRLRGATQT